MTLPEIAPASSACCPLCGMPNGCAVAAGQPAQSCWCMSADIPRQVLDSIPDGPRGTVCICPACGRAATPVPPI